MSSRSEHVAVLSSFNCLQRVGSRWLIFFLLLGFKRFSNHSWLESLETLSSLCSLWGYSVKMFSILNILFWLPIDDCNGLIWSDTILMLFRFNQPPILSAVPLIVHTVWKLLTEYIQQLKIKCIWTKMLEHWNLFFSLVLTVWTSSCFEVWRHR